MYLFLRHRRAPRSSLTQMAEWVISDLSSTGSTYFIDSEGAHIETFADAIAHAHRGIPVDILAITAALVTFFDWCEANDRHFALPGGSRIMDTGGNKGLSRPVSRNGILQSCWKYLKVAGYYCINEYGMTEMASQFYDNVLYNRFRHSNEPRYEIGPDWVGRSWLTQNTPRSPTRASWYPAPLRPCQQRLSDGNSDG